MAFSELPSHWAIGKLPEIGEINRGRSRHRPRWADHLYGGPYPFIQTLDIRSSEGRITRHTQTYSEAGLEQSKMWPAETLCISIAGNNIAETGVLMFSACFPDSVVGFRANELICNVFYVEYVLRNLKRRIKNEATGSTQLNLNIETLNEIEIPLPPLPEQKAIAHILGTLDDKIELNRRMNATLEAMARALFQSWFVDFDPVRAKLDGRPPAGLDATTAALFPAHFQDADDGKIPIGWRRLPISKLCSINSWTLTKNDDLDTLEYVEISEVSRGNIANISTYERGEEPSRARRRLRHGDTVLSTVRPDRGAYFLALNPPENRVASTGFAVLTPTKAPWAFIHAAMTQPEVSDHLGQMADGGAYPAVRPEIIGAWEVAVPDKVGILDAFQRICAPLFEQAEANRIQSRTLATLRDTLLPKLLSGELRVADINELAHSSSGTDG